MSSDTAAVSSIGSDTKPWLKVSLLKKAANRVTLFSSEVSLLGELLKRKDSVDVVTNDSVVRFEITLEVSGSGGDVEFSSEKILIKLLNTDGKKLLITCKNDESNLSVVGEDSGGQHEAHCQREQR